MTSTRGQRRLPNGGGNDYAMTLRLDRRLTNRLNLAAIVTDQASSEIIRAALRAYLDVIEHDPQFAEGYAELRDALEPPTPEPDWAKPPIDPDVLDMDRRAEQMDRLNGLDN